MPARHFSPTQHKPVFGTLTLRKRVFGTLTLRKRVFGGFAATLSLLIVLAVVMQRGAGSVNQGAARVRDGSATSEVATGIALRVDDAEARALRYALSGNDVDRKAAQDSLAGLDQAIGENHDDRLAPPVARYRAAVNAAIAAVAAHRAAVVQWQAAGTDVRTIATAISQVLERETDPDTIRGGMHLVQAFQTSDAAGSRFLASGNPADADTASTELPDLPHQRRPDDGAGRGQPPRQAPARRSGRAAGALCRRTAGGDCDRRAIAAGVAGARQRHRAGAPGGRGVARRGGGGAAHRDGRDGGDQPFHRAAGLVHRRRGNRPRPGAGGPIGRAIADRSGS